MRRRKQLRLADYDYSQPGSYFVTICVQSRKRLLGVVANSAVSLSSLGEIAANSWESIAIKYPSATVDTHCIMPNHVHAILSIAEGRGGVTPPLQKPTLGQMVAFYKYETTKLMNAALNTPGSRIWQRGFYEHVIRDERDYETRWNYILANPANWELDEENR